MEEMSMPLISIVLPSYNGARYIRESIDSILRQTYTDWELIIVDDCSNDCTLEIARKYACRDSRIRVVHNETNMKLPGSLNIGFSYANGEYLTWTSDDNEYLPEALTVMADRLESSNAAMVCADEYAVNDVGKRKWDTALSYKDDELCRKNTVGACFLYRREVYEQIGNYDTDLFCVEDYDYWLRVKERFGRIERIERVLYRYRYHGASLSSMKKEKIRRALIELRRKHLDYILEELKDRKEYLCAFYYEMLERRTMDEEIKGRIQSLLPELKNDRIGKQGKYIIFGAGEYGLRALSYLEKAEETVEFFADNNPDKVGVYKGGKEILSFEKMISLASQYDIMIAIHGDNIYPLIHQLLDHGINQYCTLPSYLRGIERSEERE